MFLKTGTEKSMGFCSMISMLYLQCVSFKGNKIRANIVQFLGNTSHSLSLDFVPPFKYPH